MYTSPTKNPTMQIPNDVEFLFQFGFSERIVAFVEFPYPFPDPKPTPEINNTDLFQNR